MACVSNQFKSKRKIDQVSYDIFFDGALLSSNRAILVIELINYFLYERQQIPLPVDQLNLRTSVWTEEEPSSSDLTTHSFSLPNYNQSQGSKNRCALNRKAKSFLTDLHLLADYLKKAFETCPEVDQVAILVGATALTPKESVLIKFPPTCPDADCLSLDVCRRTLFKQVISDDIFGSFSSNSSPSNVNVFISAPRSLPLSWFLPKHTMKSPRTGRIISLNFHCTYLIPICHELTISEEDGNLSGLEALDCTQCEKECATDHYDSHGDGCLSNSGRKIILRKLSNGFVQLNDNLTMLNDAEHLEKRPTQFCKHQKLNYIFSSCEKRFKKVINSPKGRILSSLVKSCALIGSPSLSSASEKSVESDSVSDDPVSTHSIKSYSDICIKMKDEDVESDAIDCVWYQSPLILKGFKE